jgi:zinc/manganese transport system substrate-binding protein
MKTVSGFSLAAIVLGAVALTGCAGGPQDPTKGARVVRVVAAENAWGDVAAQIGGRHASVTSLLSDPGADPHLYNSTPRDALRLARANLAIVNGLGYDDFARKLLDVTGSRRRHVLTVADIAGANGRDANPHLWYDAPRLPEVGRSIADDLAAQDPHDARFFRANAARFVASLQPLLSTLAQIEERHAGAPVAATERVAGPLIAAAGLTDRTPAGFSRAVEDGSEPSPRDTQRMADLISRHGIAALLYNAQAVTPVTQRLRQAALRAGVPVVAVSETMPRSQRTLQGWQRGQARALLKALGG